MTNIPVDREWFVRKCGRCWSWFKDWFMHYFGGLYNRADDHHVFLMAGGLSFSVITCILPLILIIFSVLGVVLNEPSIAAEIRNLIDRVMPYEQYADQIEEIVFRRVNEFILFKNVAGVVGAVGLFFAASGLFSSMRTALETAFKLTGVPSVLVGKLRDFGLVLIVIAYFLLSTAILPGLDITQELADQAGLLERFHLEFLTDFIVQGFTFVLIFASFFLIYFGIPTPRPPKKTILVTAIWAAALWQVAQLLFGFYITNVVTLRRVYGAYFFLIVAAFWIYYTSLVFIMAAEIGQLYRERAEKKRMEVSKPAPQT